MTTDTTAPPPQNANGGNDVNPVHKQRMDAIEEALKQRSRAKAAQLMAEFGRDLPPTANDRLVLASLAQNLGEAAFVRFFAKSAVQVDPGSSPLLRAAGLIASSGDIPTALQMAEQVVEKAKDFAAGWHLLGTLQSQNGDIEKAQDSLRRSLFIQPRSGLTWMALAGNKTYVADDPEVAEVVKVQSIMASTPTPNFAPFVYALGKIMDDIGNVEGAALAYTQGADLQKETASYDASMDEKGIRDAMASVSSNTFSSLKPSGADSSRPIFVLGMPRTGSTLVEQILVAHPDVAGGGELNLFSRAAMALEDLSPQSLTALDARMQNPWGNVAASYLHMIKSRFGEGGRVVDKTLTNTRLAPLIRHVLPNAPIIWMRRKTDDVALSNFTTFFTSGLQWSFDLEGLGKHMAMEDALFEKVVPVLGAKVLVVNYEDLVQSPDAHIPRILAHCGLSDHPACHAPHQLERPIQTASVTQVRKPIYTSAINRSQAYGDMMAPFREAYAREKAAFTGA